jgi:hypothetical protein
MLQNHGFEFIEYYMLNIDKQIITIMIFLTA